MNQTPRATLRDHRYLVLAEGRFGPLTSKTANSAIRYLPERVVGVVDSVQSGRTVGEVLGFGGDLPVWSAVEQGIGQGVTALLIGIAPAGGQLPSEWRPQLRAVLEAGLDLVSGLHFHIGDDPELAELAAAHGARIWDLRRPPDDLPVSTGLARNVDAFTVLTVGTDANIGKMTCALEVREALARRGARVGFAATGQTGILIEGEGIAVDAVVADFIGGAAERLVLNAAEGNDLVLVEGQGSVAHPGYSGVTLGLLHGSVPAGMILCHQPGRAHPYSARGEFDWMRLPTLGEAVRLYQAVAAPLRSAKVLGIALHTGGMSDAAAREAVEQASAETGLPATDPVRFGGDLLADALLHAREAAAAS